MADSSVPGVALAAEWGAFIEQQVRAGAFADADAVLRAAMRALRNGRAVVPVLDDWPRGGGECGAIIRAADWSQTPFGPMADWSPEMRATVANVVNSPVARVLMWGDGAAMLYNDAYSAILGTKHPAAFARPVQDIWPEAWPFNRDMLDAARRGEQRSYRDQTFRLDHGDSVREHIFDLFYTPVYEADGSVGGVMGTCVDNTERRAMDTALALSNIRFRTAMDAVHGVIWTNGADGRMVGEQPAWAALTGQDYAAYQGFGWADAVHPDDVQATIDGWQQAVAATAMFVHEHRVRDRRGQWRCFAVRALPVLDDAGAILEWVGVHTDITEHRAAEATLHDQAQVLARQVRHRERAEDQLRQLNETLEGRVIVEIDERRQAEAKLAQAQKMETMGKLTGGVAHDFNNLLQVVSGNLQLLAGDIAGNERAEARVEHAMAGVTRGSRLASQLLAFGRRQALEPKVVNATRFVRGMDDMLRRALGGGIEIEIIVGSDLWNTFIDPGQFENALLNLAINARDAMDGRGQLTIELDNTAIADDRLAAHDELAPGEYVMLAVTDTGCGMTPDVADKVFEPFFSTKAEGKGSGLGLSMVYGFVKQSGGHVKIQSEAGRGTTIRLYLPRATEAEVPEIVAEAGPVTGGTETILVVEDDEAVRVTVTDMLAELGYRVLRAADADAAMNVIDSGMAIDVLFTDVVMPGKLKSPELARRACELLPTLAVLFTSGYTDDAIVDGGKLQPGIALLSKPYTREALARRLRHVLANQAQRRAAMDPGPGAGRGDVAAPRPTPAPPAMPGADIAAAAAGATVLLIEDDTLIRMNTTEMLEDAGFVVNGFGSAEDAMAALSSMSVDVVITDLNLPGMSGVEFAERVRACDRAPGIVFATGDGQRAREAARTDDVVLTKPYDLDGLRAAVARAEANRCGAIAAE